jgi:AcrR family transcriptional regulator
MQHTRMTADERRDEVVAAAAAEFAVTGYAGTSTASIARRAGVSQPYLFQLFGTKQDLFLAAVRGCFTRIEGVFEDAARGGRAAGLETDALLEAMGHAYTHLLLADRDLLRLQLHAYAACGDDPRIREAVRDGFFDLWRTVARASGAEPLALQAWFSQGMLINVIASIGDARTPEEFYATFVGGVTADR